MKTKNLIFALLIGFTISLLHACRTKETDSPDRVHQYELGDVVYVKPDSALLVITGINFNYNNCWHDIPQYKGAGIDHKQYICLETSIYGKKQEPCARHDMYHT